MINTLKDFIQHRKTTKENNRNLKRKRKYIQKTIMTEIKLSKIKIPNKFKRTYPKPEKMLKKYKFFLKYKNFESRIVINKQNILIDGYTSYLIAKAFGFKKVTVMIKDIPTSDIIVIK